MYVNRTTGQTTDETATSKEWQAAGHVVETRHDWTDLDTAASVAELISTEECAYIPVDRTSSVSPRFDVMRQFQVGDKVSGSFNGDSYPQGTISRISPSGRVITTDTGRRFYRKGLTGSWVNGGTWRLLLGHVSTLNRSF